MGRRKSLDAQFTAHARPVCNEQKNSENNGTSQGLCATAAFVFDDAHDKNCQPLPAPSWKTRAHRRLCFS